MKESWTYKKFEDALQKVKYTRKLQTSEFLQEGNIPVISQEEEYISGYWNNTDDQFIVNSPVVIFGDHSRVLKYVDFNFVLGADGVKILSPIKELNAKFLYHYLKWYNVPNMGYSRHYKFLKEINLPIPPYSEQQQIVSELDLLRGVIEKQKAQIKELDNLAQSIFYDMFGDPVTNDKSWPVKKLEEIASSKIGLTYKPADVSDDGVVVLRSSNIQESEICLDDIVRVGCKIKESQWVKEEDILMCSRNGSFKLVGKVALIQHLPEKMTYGAFMTVIRSEYNRYLFSFFKSPAFRAQLGCAGTATINQITVKMLNEIRIPLPPLTLQEVFCAKIKVIDSMKAKVRQSLKESEELYKSRMDYYFN